MNTVTLLKQSAKELGMSEPAIVAKAGYSKNNWYNWKDGKNNPSAEAAQKIIKAIEKERAAKGLASASAVGAGAAASKLTKDALQGELVLRKANVMEAQKVVDALELLLSVA